MPDQVDCASCTRLKQEFEALRRELEERTQNLLMTEDKLTRMQKLFELANKYAEELKTEVLQLNKEIQQLRQRKDDVAGSCDVSVQTDCVGLLADGTDANWEPWRNVETVTGSTAEDTGQTTKHNESGGNAVKASCQEPFCDTELRSAWITSTHDDPEEGELEQQEEPQSVADSVREAAEAAQRQTEFVFDEATGLYFDKTSGYYYDAERCLYYEPYSGIYYRYNTESNTYEYHSRVDFSQYSEEAYKRYYQNITGEKKSKKKQKDKKKKHHKVKEADKKERKRKIQHQNCERHVSKEEKKPKLEPGSEKEDMSVAQNSFDVIQTHQVKVEHGLETGDSLLDGSCKAETLADHTAETIKEGDSKLKEFTLDVKCELHLPSSAAGEELPVAVNVRSPLNTGQALTEDDVVDGQEDGEITSSSSNAGSEDDSADSETDSSSSESSTSSEDISPLRYPPCLRLVVTKSNSLDIGSLFIVPYTGATIGRDKSLNHLVLIPDSDISNMHCTIAYNETDKVYTVMNHATGVGTLINGRRLSEPPDKCEPVVVRNYDKLQLGETSFELHIHPGNQTCDDCEPGIIQSRLQQNNSESVQQIADLKVDKETKRRREMKKIRKRYGLADAPYVDKGARYKPGYQDRSQIRRITKGSDNPYQQDDEPASVNRAIPQENKGHKLLAKLGWKEGQSLGKSQQGITEPIQAEIRSNQSAGLGSSCISHHSLDDIRKVKSTERWTKAQKRFNQLEKEQNQRGNMTERKSHSRVMDQSKNKMQFIQGETETFSLETADASHQVDDSAPLDVRTQHSDVGEN